jgi:hypothetical protein
MSVNASKEIVLDVDVAAVLHVLLYIEARIRGLRQAAFAGAVEDVTEQSNLAVRADVAGAGRFFSLYHARVF